MPDQRATVDQFSDELLEEERVAPGSLHEKLPKIVGKDRREHLVQHLRRRGGSERVEPEDGRVPPSRSPGRALIEQLRPSSGQENDGRPSIRDDPLEKIEEVRLGPVDVLDENDRGRRGCELLDERNGRRVQSLTRIERVELWSNVEPEREPEDLASLERPGRILDGGALAQPEVLSDDLPERPVRDAIAIGETTAGSNDRGTLLRHEHIPELVDETRLSHAGLPDDRHEVRLCVCARTAVGGAKQLELTVTADEHATKSAHASRTNRAHSVEDRNAHNAVRLASRFDASRCSKLEGARGGCHGSLAGEHLARLGRFLKAVGDIDHVPRHEGAPLARPADDDLARVDAHPHLDLAPKS